MSITRYNADVTAPDGGSVGISPSPGQNSLIAIGFSSVAVYGKNNGSWELIETLSESNRTVFVSFATYDEVFFKSETGEVEIVRVGFFEDNITSAKASGAPVTSVSEISDMPSFSAADAGKVLSVDSNGNLVWITR